MLRLFVPHEFDMLTLKEAKVALNTDIYHWTWPHKCIRLTVSLKEVLFCKLSALRVYHVDTKQRDLYMTSKITGGSLFLQIPLKSFPAFWIFASSSIFCFRMHLNFSDFLLVNFKSDIHLNSIPRIPLLKSHCAVHGYLTESRFGIAPDILQLTDAIDDVKLSLFKVNLSSEIRIKTSYFFNLWSLMEMFCKAIQTFLKC